MLNSTLKESEAITQLNIAREEIMRLEEVIAETMKRLEQYQIFEKIRERKISTSVEFLYNQLLFLRQCDEKFINIVLQDDKIIRLEAIESLS